MTEPGLEVPDAAREAMDALGYIKDDQAEVDAWIRNIAKPVVAAELRRMAEVIGPHSSEGWELLHRAEWLAGER